MNGFSFHFLFVAKFTFLSILVGLLGNFHLMGETLGKISPIRRGMFYFMQKSTLHGNVGKRAA